MYLLYLYKCAVTVIFSTKRCTIVITIRDKNLELSWHFKKMKQDLTLLNLGTFSSYEQQSLSTQYIDTYMNTLENID